MSDVVCRENSSTEVQKRHLSIGVGFKGNDEDAFHRVTRHGLQYYISRALVYCHRYAMLEIGFMVTSSQASWVSRSPASAPALAETPLPTLTQ